MAKKKQEDIQLEEEKKEKNTKRVLFEKNITDDKMAEMLLDLTMSKESFKEKYGFDKKTAFTVMDDLKEIYPEERLRTLIKKNHITNIYISGKRIKGAKEIRCKVSPEVHEQYKELMKGYKETVRSEIFSEILSRGMNGLLERKRAGESIVRIPARAEQEL